MKTVLCFGDSLTWGYDAETLDRHALEDRWPSTLKAALGEGFHVIAEGLNGRTTAFDDHLAGEDRNGARILPTLLGTHTPLDVIVIMLGSNDMKPWVHGNAQTAAQGMRRLVQIVRGHPYAFGASPPKILLVSPPVITGTENAEFSNSFAGADFESQKLAQHYKTAADETGCVFFDAGSVASVTPLDGVHLDAENTRSIGVALAPIVKQMAGDR